MKFVCLVYHDEARLMSLSPGELETLVSDCIAWAGELDRKGQHVLSVGLQAPRTAASFRGRGDEIAATDGPFTETKEVLGGFTLFEARDRAEALAVVANMPAARVGAVELRPALDSDGDLPDGLDQKLGAAMRNTSRGVDRGLASRIVFVSQANLGRAP